MNKIWICVAMLALAGLAREARADAITFAAISTGLASGNALTTVGFGYSITNNTSYFYQPLDISTNAYVDGIPNLIFDFPEVLPNTTVTELFTQTASATCPTPDCGLVEVVLAGPPGPSDTGTVTLSGEFYADFNETQDLGAAPTLQAGYSVFVVQVSSAAPEPSSMALVSAALLVGFAVRRKIFGQLER